MKEDKNKAIIIPNSLSFIFAGISRTVDSFFGQARENRTVPDPRLDVVISPPGSGNITRFSGVSEKTPKAPAFPTICYL